MKFSVDPWDPSYGIANEALSLEPTRAEVNAGLEVPVTDWGPIGPSSSAAAELVLFVDGVRRVEARVWLEDAAGRVSAGLCARPTRLEQSDVTARQPSVRSLSSAVCSRPPGRPNQSLRTPVTFRFASRPTTASRTCLSRSKSVWAMSRSQPPERACAGQPTDLIVIDGPLRGRQHLTHAVGYVKTHHVAYLPPELHTVIGRLAPGERTPLFVLGTSWSRLAWYMALPGKTDIPWAGVVRCECSADLPLAQATALADRVAATLPDFASEPHKEPRAPQNLYPIAGLERELRRRLGDPQLLYPPALRRSAHSSHTVGL